MITVKLYSRKDCSLCDQARADLATLQQTFPHQLEEVDIDKDPRLQKAYGELVPVIEVGPYRLKPPFDRLELQITLGAVQRGFEHSKSIDQSIEQAINQNITPWSKADSISYWLSKHYLALLNTIVFLYLGIAFLAPVSMKLGNPAPANVIYKVYGFVCHQLAFRSWFLFGEQYAYPRLAAGVSNLIPFEQATGISDQDLWNARLFEGNPILGYKVALCQRDVAIYGSILLFGLIYPLIGRRLRSIPWYLWILLGLVPIGLDGISQLMSQPPLSLIPYRESTPLLRTLTGALFGFMTAWFGYPIVEESMVETRQWIEHKLARIKALAAN